MSEHVPEVSNGHTDETVRLIVQHTGILVSCIDAFCRNFVQAMVVDDTTPGLAASPIIVEDAAKKILGKIPRKVKYQANLLPRRSFN